MGRMSKEYPDVVYRSRLIGQKDMIICEKDILIAMLNEKLEQRKLEGLERQTMREKAQFIGDDGDAGN